MKVKKALNIFSKILFTIMAIVFGITVIAATLLKSENVSNLLTQFVFKDKPEDIIVSTGNEPVRYKTWYSSVEDNLNGNGEIARLAQAEGTVLLKNDNAALPFETGEKVSLYGVTAYDPMYCLDGAGNNKINDPIAYNGKSEVYRRQFFYDEFKNAGLILNEDLQEWYNGSEGKHYRRRDYVGYWGTQANNPDGWMGYNGNKNGYVPALTEASWTEIPDSAKDAENFGKNTTAVYITGRMANEGIDLNPEGMDSGEGDASPGGNNDGTKRNTDYLAFTDEEKNLLQELGKNYDKVVVIFNQANAPQEDIPAMLEVYGIEAALWIGFPGSNGIKAVAQILSGEINPSGGLSAAWYTSRNNNPSTQNFGIKGMGNVVNVEGMYVGYRYAETRYEDTLLGSAKAGSYDYGGQISYPFGYGLSYSDFEYSDINIVPDPDPEKNYNLGGLMASNAANYTGNYGKKAADEDLRATGADPGDCDDIILNVTVTNATVEKGGVAGKENVQVYLQQPITAQDKEHKVQKPSVQLVGYGKTRKLQPGESETLSIKIDANKWFAAYDARSNVGKGGYVLSAGEYLLTVARNSNEAVNSLVKYKQAHGGTVNAEKFVTEYGEGSADCVASVIVSETRSQNYEYWTKGTSDNVHNLFSDVDPNMDSDPDNDVAYFSRFDWENTAAVTENGRIGEYANTKTGSAAGQTSDFNNNSGVPFTQSQITKFANYYGVEYDDTPYNYGWSNTDWTLSDMVGVEFDPARGASEEDIRKWSEIVGQMSEADIDRLFSDGLRKTMSIDSIGKPGTNDQNASNGFEWPFGMGDADNTGNIGNKNASYGFMLKFDSGAEIAYSTGYPCEGIVAATFNNELAYIVGEAFGEDALWSGTSGIYGFGLGLQRNPYHGRAGEFYSDDPFLTGMIGGYMTKGAQKKGLYVYNKHFALNDQDTDRNTYKAWADEQTFRQIYLRPFEMAIEIGDAMNVMIALNKLGDAWTGSSYNLMTRWLRGEAGMSGFALSDWPNYIEQLSYGILAGTCLLDQTQRGFSRGIDARYDNMVVDAAMRILYTVANSNAMNFYGDDTRTYSFDPLWYSARDAFVGPGATAIYVVFGISCAFATGMTVWRATDNFKRKKSAKR